MMLHIIYSNVFFWFVFIIIVGSLLEFTQRILQVLN